jgi:MoxR-like ATPase
MSAVLVAPERLQAATATCRQLLAQLDRILLGQEDLHRLVLTGILSRGHILLEGLPGLGKTALVKALGSVLQLTFKRVQFTPDLMPGDILGSHILQDDGQGRREMVFRPGPVFTNLLLADEINRASPKTQSAMLETMQEQSVTLLGTTRPLPQPFFVLASQNPIELEGTYPLPEAQLDRFLFRLLVRPPPAAVVSAIIHERRRGESPQPTWSLSGAELQELFAVMDGIFLAKAVADYIARLVEATHPEADSAPAAVREYVTYGASPRAAIAMAEAARGQALLAGRPTASFADVRAVVGPVLNHRLILSYKARLDRMTATQVVERLLEAVRPVELDLPRELQVRETPA